MEDTTQDIKHLQLQIWLKKPAGERLRQFLDDNEELFAFWNKTKEQLKNFPQQNKLNP